MTRLTLNAKLMLGGTALLAVSICAMGLYSASRTSQAINAISEREIVTLSESLAGLVEATLSAKMDVAKDMAAGITTTRTASLVAREGLSKASKDIEELDLKLSMAAKSLGSDYEAILVTDRNGVVYADGEKGIHKGSSLASTSYFQLAKTGKTGADTVERSKEAGLTVIPICVPILSDSGQFIGSLTTVLKVNAFANRMASVKFSKKGYVFVADKEGRLIVHPDDQLILKAKPADTKGMEAIAAEMSQGDTGHKTYVVGGEVMLTGYAPVRFNGWTVGITAPLGELTGEASTVRKRILLLGAALLAAAALGFLFISRGITRSMLQAVGGLNTAAEQVTSASVEVSSASQKLADGASEQAASLEETSSAMEEMTSMVKHNADNTREAARLVEISRQSMKTSHKSLKQTMETMKLLSASGEQTAKIIKTIDEIAFQTNLLALNAAVEAARAGEAGAGFAVVADEVRNLAMRAAEAAKSTEQIITETVRHLHEGTILVDKTIKEFYQMGEDAKQVSTLFSEISVASEEQAKGIQQVNQAIQDLDKVVQQNSATAEESAAASAELSAQAEQIEGILEGLEASVGAKRSKMDRPQHLTDISSPQDDAEPYARSSVPRLSVPPHNLFKRALSVWHA
jgi:methyl-accepting chemotaxis protein